MSNFGLVVIGAHHGFWLENQIQKTSKKILLVEPVKYNFLQLKERYKDLNNVYFENSFINDNNNKIDFFFVKENSIDKLGKHWASGIGSFSKKHILNHKSKRFNITDNDIDNIEIQPITFDELCEKHNINFIDKLLIDVEGSEKKIIESINYKKILIKELTFEYKHLDGTYFFNNELKKLIKFLNNKNFKEISRDKENITFKLFN
jgi:FkbM family methyltransferase